MELSARLLGIEVPSELQSVCSAWNGQALSHSNSVERQAFQTSDCQVFNLNMRPKEKLYGEEADIIDF